MKRSIISLLIILLLATIIVVPSIILHNKNAEKNTKQEEIGKLIDSVVERVVEDYYPYDDFPNIPPPYKLTIWYETAKGSISYLWNEGNCLTQKKLENTIGLNFPINSYNQANVFSWVKPDTEVSISRIEIREGTKAYAYATETCAGGEKYFQTICFARSSPEDPWKAEGEEWDKEM